jgi:hypothetical protein
MGRGIPPQGFLAGRKNGYRSSGEREKFVIIVLAQTFFCENAPRFFLPPDLSDCPLVLAKINML